MQITLPIPSLVLLIGPAGSGKSTFARTHFRHTEVVSSDHCRALICDNPGNQVVTPDAFELLYFIIRKRLHYNRLTVVDATNVESLARHSLLELAIEFGSPTIAIIFDLPEEHCIAQDLKRHRTVGAQVIHDQFVCLQESLPMISNEGFSKIYRFKDPEEITTVEFHREFNFH